MRRIFFIGILFLSSQVLFAQISDTTTTDTIESVTATAPSPNQYTKKLTANALIIGGYGVSLTDSVGFNEMHSLNDSVVNNSFYMRYVRVSAKYQLTEKLEANVQVNLADFKSNPQGKVLENAFLRYKANDFISLQLGQFRPFFGVEDMYSLEQHKSISWSNQYNLFNKNNWMSYQIGAAIFGSLNTLKVPLKYYFTVYNGNGKNVDDNDNSKNFSSRIEYNFTNNISLGANFATTRINKKNINAFAADLRTSHNLSDRWQLETESSYAYGHNIVDYFAANSSSVNMNDYRMSGLYVLPTVRYRTMTPMIKGVEFSCRWETLKENLHINPNARNTWTPMVSIMFLENYAAKFSLAGVIADYQHNIPGTSKHDQTKLMAQFQFRF